MLQLSQKESYTDIPLSRAGFIKLLLASAGLAATGYGLKRLEDKAALRGAALAPGGGLTLNEIRAGVVHALLSDGHTDVQSGSQNVTVTAGLNSAFTTVTFPTVYPTQGPIPRVITWSQTAPQVSGINRYPQLHMDFLLPVGAAIPWTPFPSLETELLGLALNRKRFNGVAVIDATLFAWVETNIAANGALRLQRSTDGSTWLTVIEVSIPTAPGWNVSQTASYSTATADDHLRIVGLNGDDVNPIEFGPVFANFSQNIINLHVVSPQNVTRTTFQARVDRTIRNSLNYTVAVGWVSFIP